MGIFPGHFQHLADQHVLGVGFEGLIPAKIEAEICSLEQLWVIPHLCATQSRVAFFGMDQLISRHLTSVFLHDVSSEHPPPSPSFGAFDGGAGLYHKLRSLPLATSLDPLLIEDLQHLILVGALRRCYISSMSLHTCTYCACVRACVCVRVYVLL